MGLDRLEELTQAFVARGADPALPAAIIDNGARVNQRVVVGTLADLAAKARAANLRGPTIVIVGTVVSLRDKLNWYAPERAAQRPRDLPPPRARNRGRAASRAPPKPRRRRGDNRSSAFRGAFRPASTA